MEASVALGQQDELLPNLLEGQRLDEPLPRWLPVRVNGRQYAFVHLCYGRRRGCVTEISMKISIQLIMEGSERTRHAQIYLFFWGGGEGGNLIARI